MNRLLRKTGFTLIEMLVVIAIMALAAAAIIPSLSGSKDTSNLNEGQAMLIRTLENARNNALAGIGTTNWGVHVDTANLRLFEGNSFTGGIVRQTLALPNSVVSISPVQDVVFARIKGTALSNTTIEVQHQKTSAKAKVSVTTAGVISAN